MNEDRYLDIKLDVLLMFISVIVGEWGEAPAIVSGIAIVSLVFNSVFILFRTKKDFQE